MSDSLRTISVFSGRLDSLRAMATRPSALFWLLSDEMIDFFASTSVSPP